MASMSPPVPLHAPPPVPGRARLLANTGWNLAGQVVPLAVGIAVLPLLIRLLGLDRYGFLTLVWVLVGYASIFDFGIGRVLIRVVARVTGMLRSASFTSSFQTRCTSKPWAG